MSDTETQPHRKWRERLANIQASGERMEAIAEQHLHIPFEVRPDWSPPTLDWCEWGDSLEDFCSRVALVAKHYGPPGESKAEHFHGQYAADQSPDLAAKWKQGDDASDAFEIVVRVLDPEGCKLDPRYDYVAGASSRVHPECKAVVEQLMDLPEPVNAT